MKLAALPAILALALLTAGCGGGAPASTSTDPGPPDGSGGLVALRQVAAPIFLKIRHSPETVAYNKAMKSIEGNQSMAELRRNLVALLPKLAAYARYLRSIHVPSCLRPFQSHLARLIDENATLERGTIKILATGDRRLVRAYLNKAQDVTDTETTALTKSLDVTVLKGGDGRC